MLAGVRVSAVHHVAVRTPDLDASERFYVGVLGLAVVRRFAYPDGTPRSIWVGLPDGTFIALERSPDAHELADQSRGWHCVALRIDVAEREEWRRRLIDAGHSIERETEFTLYVRDPSGALVGLSHHPDPA